RIPVNPSGGAQCGTILYASGLARIMESHLQVTGRAGGCQIPGARYALAHAQAGLGMQSGIVFVIEA
ncbi:MAG: thiolase domain-containing protein, partial [Spirochaetia bacterium]|nr:thiolase domain-containing protein [Spirochaetia bacterium]